MKKKQIHEQAEAQRKKLDKSKYSIAKETKISQQSVGTFLSGEHIPRLDKAEAIIRSLGGELTISWKDTAAISTTIPKIKKKK